MLQNNNIDNTIQLTFVESNCSTKSHLKRSDLHNKQQKNKKAVLTLAM